MVPELTGEKQKKHKYLYWEFNEKGGKQGVILHGRWKGIRLNLVEDLNGPIELYNLKLFYMFVLMLLTQIV